MAVVNIQGRRRRQHTATMSCHSSTHSVTEHYCVPGTVQTLKIHSAVKEIDLCLVSWNLESRRGKSI